MWSVRPPFGGSPNTGVVHCSAFSCRVHQHGQIHNLGSMSPRSVRTLCVLEQFKTCGTPQTSFHSEARKFGRFSEQSPLPGYEPNAPIEVSSEDTPIVLPSRRWSNADGLATALVASEAGDRSDVERLASPLFPQEREASANPFSASFFTLAFKLREIEARCESVFKHREIDDAKPQYQKMKSRLRECAGGKRFCLNREIFIIFFERKADPSFQRELAAQTKL